MTTVEQVARAALADLGETTGLVDAVRWVNERITEVAVRRMKAFRKVGAVVIPAAITTGTITLTIDTNLVTPDAAALATWTGLDFSDGWFLQTANSGVWYRIIGSVPTTGLSSHIRLDQNATATQTAVGYRLVKRFIRLPKEAAYLGTFAHSRLRRAIRMKSQTQLDLHVPDRPYATYGPSFYSEFGEDRGERIVEFYPYSTVAEYILFTYWEPHRFLQKEEPIPTAFAAHDLKEGIKANLYSALAQRARKERPPQLDLAAQYSNLEARQETKWKLAVVDILHRDRGVEDLVLLLDRRTQQTVLNWNAHTEVYLRGNRP